jgi:hypothetical protein
VPADFRLRTRCAWPTNLEENTVGIAEEAKGKLKQLADKLTGKGGPKAEGAAQAENGAEGRAETKAGRADAS